MPETIKQNNETNTSPAASIEDLAEQAQKNGRPAHPARPAPTQRDARPSDAKPQRTRKEKPRLITQQIAQDVDLDRCGEIEAAGEVTRTVREKKKEIEVAPALAVQKSGPSESDAAQIRIGDDAVLNEEKFHLDGPQNSRTGLQDEPAQPQMPEPPSRARPGTR